MSKKLGLSQRGIPENQDRTSVNVLNAATQSTGFYTSHKQKLLSDFDETANLIMDFVESVYGRELAATLHHEALEEYEKLIPDIPHLKGSLTGQLNSFLMITAQEIAVWKAMKKHDMSPAEAWEICHEALTRRMKKFPAFKRWLLTQLMYSGVMKRRIRKRVKTNMHIRSGEFEVKYIIDDGTEFDYGIDYVACGNYKFALEQGVEEFAPYICMSDIALGKALGWGLTRTETLADGCSQCDFRFKKGGDLRISSKTPEVQETIDRIAQKEVHKNDT